MPGDIESLNVLTTLPIPVERILRAALEHHEEEPFDRIIVIGMRGPNLTDEYFASSESEAGPCLYDVERFKHYLMKEADRHVSLGD